MLHLTAPINSTSVGRNDIPTSTPNYRESYVGVIQFIPGDRGKLHHVVLGSSTHERNLKARFESKLTWHVYQISVRLVK